MADEAPNLRLRRAIDASPHSIRKLSHVLAGRDDVQQTAESVRNHLGRVLSGRAAISNYWADVLESELQLEAGSLREPDHSKAIQDATALIRRLDAGETLPAELLLEVAEATEAAGRAALRLAARFRRDAKGQSRRASSNG